jgi:hypothetical protein
MEIECCVDVLPLAKHGVVLKKGDTYDVDENDPTVQRALKLKWIKIAAPTARQGRGKRPASPSPHKK